MTMLRRLTAPFAWLTIAAVRLYRRFVSPLLPPCCRFTPSCSRYMIEAIKKKGLIVGVCKGLWRILRCNPFCKGGHDPVD
jgi:putative membrane protein insertion efficiency factor